MKIAFDLHGVLEKNPEQFKALIKFLRSLNVEVVLMSGPPVEHILQELKPLGFNTWDCPWNTHFNAIHSIVDYLRTQIDSVMRQDERGNWWTDDESWWSSKAIMCILNKVDVLIDDNERYQPYFDKRHRTRFILCKTIDFDSLRDSIIGGLR